MLHATYVYEAPPSQRRLARVRHGHGPLGEDDVWRLLGERAELPAVLVLRGAALLTLLHNGERVVAVTSDLEAEEAAAEHAARVLETPWDGLLLAEAIADSAHGHVAPGILDEIGETVNNTRPPTRHVLRVGAVCACSALAGLALVLTVWGVVLFSRSGSSS